MYRHIKRFASESTPSSFQLKLKLTNPYNGKLIKQLRILWPVQGLKILKEVIETQQHFAATTRLQDRIDLCEAVLQWFSQNLDQVASDITSQMGKPIEQSKQEVHSMIARGKKIVSMANDNLAEMVITDSAGQYQSVIREPLGVIMILASFNFPMLSVSSQLFPAILAGNAVLLKPSLLTPLCTQHFADAFATLGAPKLLVNNFPIADCDIYQIYLQDENDELNLMTLSGSVENGKELYKEMARINKDYGAKGLHNSRNAITDCILELGGKDAAYVTEDVQNINEAAEQINQGAFYNAGQLCCSTERVYVHDKVYDQFVSQIVQKAQQWKIGDPMQSSTTMGLLPKPGKAASLQNLVSDAVSKGAKILTGGKLVQHGKGSFLEATVIENVPADTTLSQVENFGPVLQIERVKNDAEAIKKMNNSKYGLSSSIFTKDKNRALKIAQELQVGNVFMNQKSAYEADLPVSSRKNSGRGFNLGKNMFNNYTQLKVLDMQF